MIFFFEQIIHCNPDCIKISDEWTRIMIRPFHIMYLVVEIGIVVVSIGAIDY